MDTDDEGGFLLASELKNERLFLIKFQTITGTCFRELEACIHRCVEYGYITQILLILENLDYLVSICESDDGQKEIDNRLILRKCDPEVYIIAKSYGFEDIELEKRITLIQRLFRKQQPLPDLQPFTGPTPEEYMGEDCEKDGELESRYWGYRHASYYVRWNRHARVHFLQLAMKHFWYGNCRMDGYIDAVEGGDSTNIDLLMEEEFEYARHHGWHVPDQD